MSIVFLTQSLLTTVQDLGRNHYRRFGINPNGVMDSAAARLANILVGNAEGEAVLEMHFPAPKILFEKAACFALGGANFGARLDGQPVESWRTVFASPGSVLSFPEKLLGSRIYLAVRGGFQIEKWLGSTSTNLKAKVGGFGGKPLQKNDRLFFNPTATNERQSEIAEKGKIFRISRELIPPYSGFPTVRVTAGAEFEKLDPESRQNFQSQNFLIRRESDRMGFRLEGAPLRLNEKLELISSAANFGTIQLLPDDGQLIVLMADHQTSGGYPRVAHIVSRDLPLAAQLGAGDKLSFALISLEEAENLTIEFEKDLNLLRTAVRFQLNL